MTRSHPMYRELKLLLKDEGFPSKKDLLALFVGILLIGYLVWDAEPPLERLIAGSIMLLFCFALCGLAMFLQLRWELPWRRAWRLDSLRNERRKRFLTPR